MVRIRCVSIAINKDKLLLLFRIKKSKNYFTFPGGGLEDGEEIESAVLRELMEETSMRGNIDKLLYKVEYSDGGQHWFYKIKNITGNPKLHPDSEEYKNNSIDNFYEPRWVDIDKLSELLVYPLEIRDCLINDIKNNFKNCPRLLSYEISDLRN